MDGKAVDAVVRRLARPVLRRHGFERFTGRSAWRFNDHTVELIVFRSFTSYVATRVGSTTFSFAVTAGVAYRCLKPCPERPRDHELTFRFELGKYLRQPVFHPYDREAASDRPDVWFVLDDGSNVEEAVSDAVTAIEKQAVPLLDVYKQPHLAFDALLHDRSSNPSFGAPGITLPGAVGSPRWTHTAHAIGQLTDPHAALRIRAATTERS